MKAFVLSVHPLNDNRISKHIVTLLEADVSVVYLNCSKGGVSPRWAAAGACRVVRVQGEFTKGKPLTVARTFILMAVALLLGEYDLVHFHDALLLPLSPIPKLRGKKVFYDRHESYEKMEGVNARMSARFEMRFASNIDGMIIVSSEQGPYQASLGVANYELVPNYQSKKTFSTHPPTVERGSFKMIYVGVMEEINRSILFMLDVVERVLRDRPDASCFIGGPVQDRAIERRLRELEDGFVNFEYAGVLDYSRVVAETVSSDLGLYFVKDVPNNHLSSPNKVFEYMLAGVAIIGMGTFNHIDEIDGAAGKIFPFSATSEEVAKFITDLAEDRSRLRGYKRAAARIGDTYTWESVAGRYLDLYSRVLT